MSQDDLSNHEIAVAYLRGLWRRFLAKVLCHYGHHDYETHAVGEDHAVLECFYCLRLKKSYLPCNQVQKKPEDTIELHGTLYPYFETGTEGVIWVLLKDGVSNFYESMEGMGSGDRLTVYGKNYNDVLFDGKIETDYNIGWKEYPLNPGHGQPCALGYWIHWTQSGMQPDDWARLFFHDLPLRAKLIRNAK